MSDYTAEKIELFWSRVAIAGEDDCWNWKLKPQSHGYGVIRMLHHSLPQLKAHRVAYEITYGDIPDNLYVLHKCDNRMCCNPSHLFLGTHADNMKDMIEKGRQAHGEEMPRRKLSWDEVSLIRDIYAQGGTSHRRLAAAFGVSFTTIRAIVIGRKWKGITR